METNKCKVCGSAELEEYSELNRELFTKAKEIMDDNDNNSSTHWHIGWCDVSDFINWLEENYHITEKLK